MPWRRAAEAARTALIEMVAEADDALMEKFFEAGTLTQEELLEGLVRSVRAGTLFPVFCASGLRNIGVQPLANALVTYVPSPADRPFPGADAVGRRPATLAASTPARCFSGSGRPWPIRSPGASRSFASSPASLKSDTTVHNLTRDVPERFGHLLVLAGQDADARAGAARGRPRRGREAEGHPHERHARRSPGQRSRRRRSRFPSRSSRTPSSRRAGATRTRSGRRCSGSSKKIPSIGYTRDAADARPAPRRAGPAAHRGHRREAAPALRRRGQPQAAAHPVPRNHHREDRGARPAQEADGRPRPVRRLQDSRRAAAARRRFPVRGRYLRRLHSPAVRAGRRERHPGRPDARVSRRAIRWSTSA